MPITVEAVIDPSGRITLVEPITVTTSRRAFLTVLDEAPSTTITIGHGPTLKMGALPTLLPPWANRFESLGQIGSGGMGFVHKVRHLESGKIYCLKQLLSGGDSSDLQIECRALGRLSHPGIVGLIDFDALAEPPFFVTEYVEGPTLGQFMDDRQVPVAEAVTIAAALFDAVAYAHEQNVIHRDLKPANIILEDGNPARPRILDFGLAIVDRFDARDKLTGSGRPAGTIVYMAPEQMRGERLTPACDVYALGQILWEMLSGKRAFDGSSMYAIVEAKMRPIDGLTLPAGFPSAVADCVAAATRLEPINRPGAREMSRQLSRL